MMIIKKGYILFAFILFFLSANFTYAQSRTITGNVKDENGQPLNLVSVTEIGGTKHALTDEKGNYSISVSDGTKFLQFSCVGKKDIVKPIIVGKPINVQMELSESRLNDVVVIGYGTSKRKDLTGSISTLSGDALVQGNPTNILSGMQGKIPGVVVTQSDGTPGGSFNVQVRGANSFLGGTQPLYVIDGIPYVVGNGDATPSTTSGSGEQTTVNPLSFLNPNDIESIDVLKDASATAIYGSRGANGVVIITTKKGKSGEDKVEADFNTGIASPVKEIKVLNAYEYATMENEGVSNANYFEPSPTPRNLPYPGNYQQSATNPDSMVYFKGPKDYIGHSTDWQKMIFRTGITNNYTLSFSGGDSKGNYLISGNYLNQAGVLLSSKFNQYSIRANITRNVKKWLVIGSNTSFASSTNKLVKTNNENLDGGVGVVKAALAYSPTLLLYDSATHDYTAATQVSNPYLYITQVKNQIGIAQIFSANYIEATITKHLKFRQNVGISYFNNQREQYYPRTVYEGQSALGLAYQAQGWYTSITSESLLTYAQTYKKHDFNIVAGATYEDDESRTKSQQASDFVNDVLQDNNMAGGANYTQPITNRTKSNIVSFLGRITDSYDDRYLFTLSFRSDGSSKFTKQNRWSYFPSGAFAWKIINERFMKRLRDKNVLNDAKLRLSYGRTGNQAISSYATFSKLISFPYTFNGSLVNGYADDQYSGPANPNLKWETTDQYDAGLDLSFLNERLSFHGDIYYKRTHDLLQNITIPPSTGYSNELINSGEIANKGLELMLEGVPVKTKNFVWDVSGNISFNRNKILSLGNGLEQQFATRINTNGDQPFIQAVGKPIGALYGYVEDGIYKNEAEVRADPVMAGQGDAIIKRMVGEIKYHDFDHNGVITSADQTYIGDVNPKFTYGLTNNFSYKNFSLNFLIQGSYGNDIINMNSYFLANTGQFNNITQKQYNDRWTFTNWKNAKSPKAEDQYWRSFHFTRRFIEDGSYIRLKSVTLSYNIKLKTNFFRTLRAYVSGVNLITITKYSGYDPDVNGYGDDASRRGVDMGGYPNSKVINIGVQCIF